MNDKYITLKSGLIISRDILAVVPYSNVFDFLPPSKEITGYSVLFSGGQKIQITIDDYNELKEHLK